MRPMLATPTERPPHGPQWRHEIKWDGIRALVNVCEGQVTLRTRSGRDCSARFPEITESRLRDFGDLLLDGELVAMSDGHPDFSAVMHRLTPGGGGVRRRGSEQPGAPVQLVVFDVLRAAGHDVLALPWEARRELLLGAGLESDSVLVPAAQTDGEALFAATARQGLEGVVSKRLGSRYQPGVRSEDWLKSVHRRTESFVVGGWRPVTGTTGTLGALLLGEFVGGELRYRGRVGTGFSRASGAALLDVLTPAPRCPFVHPDDALPPEDLSGTHWVRPAIVVDVSYLHRSVEGRLRQPAYKGLRLDVGVPRG